MLGISARLGLILSEDNLGILAISLGLQVARPLLFGFGVVGLIILFILSCC